MTTSGTAAGTGSSRKGGGKAARPDAVALHKAACFTWHVAMDRSNLFNVRLSDDEIAMLRELADSMGLSLSDAIRQLVRKAHADQGLGRKRRRSK